MVIRVASQNKVKIDAVKEIITQYDFLKNHEVRGIEVSSGVSEQPKTLEETILGSENRARNAFGNCKYSIGIEGGLMKIPIKFERYAQICSVSIYDGQKFYDPGLTPAYIYPKEVTDLVFNEGLDISQAFQKSGFTEKTKLGSHEGTSGVLTNGRIPRKEYIKIGLIMALTQIENSHFFK